MPMLPMPALCSCSWFVHVHECGHADVSQQTCHKRHPVEPDGSTWKARFAGYSSRRAQFQ
jgi:hypothetical protein